MQNHTNIVDGFCKSFEVFHAEIFNEKFPLTVTCQLRISNTDFFFF